MENSRCATCPRVYDPDEGHAGNGGNSDRLALDHFVMRVLTDALNEATSRYWMKRAGDFDNARPRIGDFHSNTTPDRLRARWYALTEIAAACRNRAAVSPLDDIAPEVVTVWGEAS